jgi:hypothetical protein
MTAALIAVSGSAAFAAAKIKSHSNVNNNRAFNDGCVKAGGHVEITDNQSVCKLVMPALIRSRPTPASKALSDACAKDGGAITVDDGVATCVGRPLKPS